MYGVNNILSTVSDYLTPPESLAGYGDTYIVTDLRKRSKKEPGDVKSFKSFKFESKTDAPKLFENVEPIKHDWFGIYKVFKGVDNGIIYVQYTFKKDYNADFVLNSYSIDEKSKTITLTFDYIKAWTTKGYTSIRVRNVVMTLPVCNITFTNDIEVSGLFGLYDFVEAYIKALKNAQSNYRANSNDYKDLQYNIERYQNAWNEYAAQSAPVESTEPAPAQESDNGNNLTIAQIVELAQSKIKDKNYLFVGVNSLPTSDIWNLHFNVKAGKVYIELNFNDYNDNAIKQQIDFDANDLRPSEFWKNNAEAFDLVKNLIDREKLMWIVSSYNPTFKDIISFNFDFDSKYFKLNYICDNGNEFWHCGFIATIDVKKFAELLTLKIYRLYKKGKKEPEDKEGVYYDIVLLNDIINYVLKGKKPYGKNFRNSTREYSQIKGLSFEDNPFWAVKIPESEGLGKPTIKFEFNNNDELKAFLKDNKENIFESYIDASVADSDKLAPVNGIAGNPPAGIFNCPESELICNGFVPTYQRLADYSHLIDTAENSNVLKGYGFDDTTLNTLIDAVKNYKQVARLAAHLAADTPEQTAFNIWHFEHCNIKYNYDTPGKEEIRTPARTWLDRKDGVDCDCLAVFTAALLLNLGYKPKFEIVAFANKPHFSHIYVNLDGMAIDRVLPTFNRRPLLITNTMLMDIPVYQLNGLMGINAELQGVYESSLRRFAHTQSGEDLLNMRKTQILITLQGCDYNGFRLAGLLMPYVQGIGEDGAYYFDNPELAEIAANADNEIIAAEMRGASDEELNGIFKKIGKAVKKAVKKVADTTKKVVKTTAKAVKTVAKATANTVKAAAKSTANAVKATANVVKAGAQAVTGKGSAAKATLKKAGSQVKAAVTQPIKQATKDTKAVVKNAVVEPTKTAVKVTVVEPTKTVVKAVAKTIKIAGKIFKVLLVKINPITVLMRNSLRLLVAVNFLGMATRLAVAKMTKDAAIAAGYTAEMWEDAKKAYDRVIKFFTKMGGKQSNIEKAIVNGSKKKALFKKDYKPESQIIENGEDNATLSGTSTILCGLDGLGAAVTVASALAAVGAFFKTIWKWLCKIVPKGAKAVANVVKKVAQNEDVQKIATAAKDAAVNKAIDTIQSKIGGNTTTPGADDLPDNYDGNDTTDDKKKWIKYGLIAAAGVTAVALIASSGKKKSRKAA